jgi:nucleoid-associated protein YgaU
MDQRIRLTVATAVMLVGLGLALCFRRESGNTALTLPPQGDLAAFGKQTDSRSVVVLPSPPAPRSVPVAPQELRRPSPAIVTPSDQPAPPPEFPKSYPASNKAAGNQMASARWGSAMAEMLPERHRSTLKHKIVDGDTLPLLAERYLGSESRAMEIFQANRDVLADPNILPITKELKIPSSEQVEGKEQRAGSTLP